MESIRELVRGFLREALVNRDSKNSLREYVRVLAESVLLEGRFPSKSEVLAKRKDDPETLTRVDLVQKTLEKRFGSKTAKYFPIMFDYLDRNPEREASELLDDAVNTLIEFDKMSGVDINRFASYEAFDSFVQETLLNKHAKKSSSEKENVAVDDPGDSTLLYEDDEVVMYRVNSSAGAHSLAGKDTSWCIARKSGQFYDQYTSTNQIFYFAVNKTLPVNDPTQKVAIRVTKNLDDNTVSSINYTSKKNDGDNKKPDSLPYWNKVKSVIQADAAKQPPTLLVKVKSGKASQEEIDQLWANYKSSTMKEKRALNRLTGGKFTDRLRVIDETKFDSIPKDWKELDAALIEKLIQQVHDDNFYKKVLELHNPFLDKEVVRNTDNKYILQQVLLTVPGNDDLRIVETIAEKASDQQTFKMLMDYVSKNDNDSRASVVIEMINNRMCSVDTIITFTKYPEKRIRTFIANSIKTPHEILAEFAKDPDDEYLRMCVAKNSNTTPDILDELAKDTEHIVRREVANNLNTAIDTLVNLKTDSDKSVRYALLNNPNTPPDVKSEITRSRRRREH